MAAPHREDRIGELANATEIAVLSEEILALKDYVTVSGGWAWHFSRLKVIPNSNMRTTTKTPIFSSLRRR